MLQDHFCLQVSTGVSPNGIAITTLRFLGFVVGTSDCFSMQSLTYRMGKKLVQCKIELEGVVIWELNPQ